MRIWITLSIVLFVSAYAGVSFAFPSHSFFHMPASGKAGMTYRAGGGGIYGTGGAQDYSVKCSHCHIDDTKTQGMITIDVATDVQPEKVNGQDAYKPGQDYHFIVSLLGEHLGGMGSGNVNGMALTVEDATGKLAGVLTSDSGQSSSAASCATGMAADPYPHNYNMTVALPAGKTTVIYGDCHAVLALAQTNVGGQGKGLTQWSFTWKAPMAGTGPVTIFVGVVDGDSDGLSSLGDDVAEVSVPLLEGP